MAGGQRIDDHTSWIGKAPEGCVFPEGTKKKQFTSAEGAGELNKYEQTSEEVKESQMIAERKVESHKRKDYMRN